MKNFSFLIGSLILFPLITNAQSIEDKKIISSYSNIEGNIELKKTLIKENNERQLRLKNFLSQNVDTPKKTRIGTIGSIELMDVLPNGEKIYAQTTNDGAATTARAKNLYSGGSLGINIQGQNMIAGVWDGGSVRNTHQEFMVNGTSKITIQDGSAFADHATHVGGTIAAQGIVSTVRGLAFNSSLLSYDWDSDLVEMLGEASTGLLVSNHSYAIGSLNSTWFYGAYDSRAQQMDNICHNNPYYLPVVAAGNERGETRAVAVSQRNNKGGYDMIFGHGNAKNVLTVAAVYQVTNYVSPASVLMSDFSSWGPSDDGRIKPEISMKGVSVKSTLSTSDTATGNNQGTSMAAPGIAGVALLLQQYNKQLYNNYLRAASIKGLILHTADEAGLDPGPDAQFGWGLVNASNAAVAIRDKNSTNAATKSVVEELTLTSGSTYTKSITASGSQPLKVSISWTDPESLGINNGTTDPTIGRLVNDLDVKVTKDDTIYYPWKLQGMALYAEPATNVSTNNVDNFERVDINNPSGTYTITVTNKGMLSGGSQNFTLIATSENLSTLATNETKKNEMKVDFYPNPAKDYIHITEKDRDVKVNIYDASGKLVITSKLEGQKLNIMQLVKGNYFANYITKDGEIKNFKFIKE